MGELSSADPQEICRKIEDELPSRIAWRASAPALVSFMEFAEATASAEGVLRYGALLYPNYIKVEGVVVRADRYEPENWKQWREKLDPIDAAAMVNHIHVTDLMSGDYDGASRFEDSVGSMLASFWQMAVDRQFPSEGVRVEYDGDVVNTFQSRDGSG